MQLTCPNCHTPLNLQDETLDKDASCPTCGSKVPCADPAGGYLLQKVGPVGHFKLIAEIGRGQFGAVWRASDTVLDREVAIKIPLRELLNERAKQRFLHEAKAAASLDHPRIVRVFEAFEQDDQVYIVSELIEGDTLRMYLTTEEFSYRETAEFIAATALAVDYANERGIIHRDLKPGNILVDDDRQPHITDFGLARHNGTEYAKGVPGHPMGSFPYMPPEQSTGEVDQVDRRSDVYALGMVLYEMLTGRRPLEVSPADFSVTEMQKRVQTEEPVAPRAIDKHLPRDLEVICQKAISKSKDQRYATAAELAEDLQRFLDGIPITARPLPLAERTTRWFRKNSSLAAVGLIALCTSVLSVIVVQRDLPTLSVAPQQVIKPLTCEIQTFPAGAKVTVFPLDARTGEPLNEKAIRSPGQTPVSLDLMPGYYLVVAKLEDGRFHEVYRQVPLTADATPTLLYPHRCWEKDRSGKLRFFPIRIPRADVTEGMAEFSEAKAFKVGRDDDPANPVHTVDIAAFYMDAHEVTIDEFRAQFGGEFAGNLKPPHPERGELPMTGTLFDYAIACVEQMGKRLPTEFEYEFAATNGGKTRFPWGKEPRSIPFELSSVGEPSFDRTSLTELPVQGLLTNGAEFTISPFSQAPAHLNAATAKLTTVPSPSGRMFHVIEDSLFQYIALRGGTRNADQLMITDLEQNGSRYRTNVPREQRNNHIAFRGVRSQKPRE